MTAVDIVREVPLPATTRERAGATSGAAPLGPRDEGAWRGALRRGAIAYVASRLLVLLGAAVVAARPPRGASASSAFAAAFRCWDGEWYLRVARDGYPAHVPAGIDSLGRWPAARLGFFPLYPLVVNAADHVLPGTDVLAAVLVNLFVGAAVVLLVGVLTREWFGFPAAGRAMVLTALVPGSVVLTLAYSEALLLALAAGCLLALQRRLWWTAGVLAAFATATRPNGVALVAACAVAALEALRQRREWRCLVAPALAPLGVVAFHLFLEVRTGQGWIWFRVQHLVWQEHLTYGASTLWQVRHVLSGTSHTWDDILTTATVLATVVLVCVAWKVGLSLAARAYTAVILLLMVLPSTVTARPRFLYTAFPLLIALAAWWPAERAWARRAWPVLLGACALALVGLTVLYGSYDTVA